ncbi:hypothetical protein P153DRAFT_367925, partial [Dothidotthia symphoricarpi CBS 119687]
MSANRTVVRLRPGCSDGDATHIPRPGKCTQVNPPTLYLEKIGQQWMEERGEAQAGVKYVLESLPPGYSMWQRPRGKGAHVDKYLYGHPSHRAFDSPNRFYPHFAYLVQNAGNSIGCPCTVCMGGSGVLPKTSPNNSMRTSSAASSRPPTATQTYKLPTAKSAPVFPDLRHASQIPAKTSTPAYHDHPQAFQVLQPQPTLTAPLALQPTSWPKVIRPGMSTTRTDEKGTPDIYRNLIEKLRRDNVIDETIEEPLSPDWKAEQEILPTLLKELKVRDKWVPRAGDIVLYVRELSEDVDIVRNNASGEFKLFDGQMNRYIGSPAWEAGLIGQIPTEMTTIDDIIEDGDRPVNITYSGVRIEPLPNVNDPDKSLSKRYKYFPIRQVRPFILWKELLHQIPQERWHPTITNALTVTATMSLIGKHRFRGTWPNAQIYCHGIHLGYEMLAVGDVVRLLPISRLQQTECSDILVIKSIRLKWSGLDKASNNDWDDNQPYNSTILIYGSAYTSDASRLNKEWLSNDNVEPPRVADGYPGLHPLHPPTKEIVVPMSRILGRLYERNAMALWLNSHPDDLPGLDPGRQGLLEGRAFAHKNDRRIVENPGSSWYWGDNRADALDLQTINGLEVAKHDPERKTKEWRHKMDQLQRLENEKARLDAKPAAPLGLRRFMAPGTDALPVRVQPLRVAEESGSGTSTATSSVSGKKRSHIVNLDTDEEDEDEDEKEIRAYTKIIEDMPSVVRKKPKVMVVI